MDYRKEAPPLIVEYLSWHENIKGHSPLTVKEYALDLRSFFRCLEAERGLPAFEDLDLEAVKGVTPGDVHRWLARLSEKQPLQSATVARHIFAVKGFYQYLAKNGYLEADPLSTLEAPAVKNRVPGWLTEEESRELLDTVSGAMAVRNYCILTLLLNCGLRASELVALDVSDIKGDTVRVRGKGLSSRCLYLNDACLEALDAWLKVRKAEGPALFNSIHSNRMTSSGLYKMVKVHLRKAGLDGKLSTHSLRHTTATMMLHSGVDIRTVQEVLGHKQLNSTQIYTHITDTDLKAAADAMPLRTARRIPAAGAMGQPPASAADA